MTQTIWLPWPPTSNTMFGLKGHHRFVSKRYREWKDEAGLHIMAQRPVKMDSAVEIHIALTPPTKRKWDLDNRVKPVLDALVSHQIIADDNSEIVRRIVVEAAHESQPGASVTLTAVTHAGASSDDDLRQSNDAPRLATAGHRSGVQLPRPRSYDWQDDAFKSYRLACDSIGERIMRQRIVAAIRGRA